MLIRYSILQLLGKLIPGLIGFAAVGLLTRLLRPEEFGIYGLISALVQLVVLGGFSWLGVAVVRLATGQADERLRPASFATFSLLVLLLCVVGVAAFLINPTRDQAAIISASIFGAIVFAYFDFQGSLYVARCDFVSPMLQGLARGTFGPAAAIAVALWGGGGVAVSFAYFLAALPAVVIVGSHVGSRPRIAFDSEEIKRIVRFGLPLAGSIGLFAIPSWGDRVILNHLSGTGVVGLYAAATIIVQNTLLLAGSAIGSAALPLAVLAYESGRPGDTERQLNRNLVALLAFLVPAALGLCTLAPNIAAVLVGHAYREAVIALTPYLAAAAVMSSIRANFVDHCFHLARNSWYLFRIAALMATCNIVALVLLVPSYGYVGAGAAAAITAAVGLVHGIVGARNLYHGRLPAFEILKVAVATLVMMLALEPILSLSGLKPLLLQVFVGSAAYGAVAFALNLLNLRRTALALLRHRVFRPAAPEPSREHGFVPLPIDNRHRAGDT